MDKDKASRPGPRKKVIGPSTLTKPKARGSQGQSPMVNDKEDDEDAYSQPKIHPKKIQPGRPGLGQKKLRAKPTVIESDESSDDDQAREVSNQKKNDNSLQAPSLTASQDSDIEEIANPMESPEGELGELSKMTLQIQSLTKLS